MRLSILDCGAVADGVTKSTDAINEAINRVSEAGGGYVIIPPGEYVSGTIILKSNVYLFLEPGSTVFGSMENEELMADCKNGAKENTQIFGEDLYNCGVLGHGTFDLRRENYHVKPKLNGRPGMIRFRECTNVTIKGVTLRSPGWFTILLRNNTNVTIDSIVLDSADCENGDGIDFSGSKNVTISNCKVSAGDDAIGLKDGGPCENFTITNCVLSSKWAGIRIGPESSNDMLNITVSNCVFNDCSDGIKIQNYGGGRFEDFTFSNLNMVNVLRPIFITYNPSRWWRGKTGTFKRLLIDNVIARMGKRPEPGWFEDMIVIHGLPDYHIEDVMINNMHVIAPGGGKEDDGSSAENEELFDYMRYPDLVFQWEPYPSSCMYIRNVSRIRLSNCVFETALPDKRPAIAAQSVNGIRITNTELNGTDGLIRYCKVNGLNITNSEGTVIEESPEYVKRLNEFAAFSREVEKKFIDNDNLLIKLGKMQQTETLAVSEPTLSEAEFTFDHQGGEGYLKIDGVLGSPKVFLNGKEIYFLNRKQYYDFVISVAVDLTDYLAVGKNVLKIKLEGVEDNFENKKIGLFSPEK